MMINNPLFPHLGGVGCIWMAVAMKEAWVKYYFSPVRNTDGSRSTESVRGVARGVKVRTGSTQVFWGSWELRDLGRSFSDLGWYRKEMIYQD